MKNLLISDTLDWAMPEHAHREPIESVFTALFAFMDEMRIDGGCHLLAAMSCVLLKEAGVDSTLNAGWVRLGNGPLFTHSWSEIEGRVFDLAISRPNRHRREFRQPIVLAGFNSSTKQLQNGEYGTGGGEFNQETVAIGTGTIGSWADAAPVPEWFWLWLPKIGARAGLNLEKSRLRQHHAHVKWRLRSPNLRS